jgi:glycosyltransferase involved in cell wall biosynthesis
MRRSSLGIVRVALADPPAFTPAYDHELACALARAGVDVDLLTSRFRFGDAPTPEGYTRREIFYPLSSRVFRRSRLRLPLKALEHPLGLGRLAFADGDILHLQWLATPEADRYLLRSPKPLVFTAHDLLPRRTAHKRTLWRALFDRFARVVVHSERGRETLAALGVPDGKLRVIRHPVTPRELERSDDGRTVLALGVIRPYKQVEHAVEAVRRVPDARLLVAGDPTTPLPPLNGADARLGYLSPPELDRALADATIAVFPYRAELDQSGALLQALGAGIPAVVYDVGGLPEPVREFEAGLVVPADDVGALADAIATLLDDPAALAAARAGARRAREALTWDASAAAHLALYRELV